MVKNILGLIAGGYDLDGILSTYPQLSAENISDALHYVSQVIDEDKHISRAS